MRARVRDDAKHQRKIPSGRSPILATERYNPTAATGRAHVADNSPPVTRQPMPPSHPSARRATARDPATLRDSPARVGRPRSARRRRRRYRRSSTPSPPITSSTARRSSRCAKCCGSGARIASKARSSPPARCGCTASRRWSCTWTARRATYPHVLALFRRGGAWGAMSKTNGAVLRFRDPVYRSLRELAMSYFHEYGDRHGRKTLRSHRRPSTCGASIPRSGSRAQRPAPRSTTGSPRCGTTRSSRRGSNALLSPRDAFERAVAKVVQYPARSATDAGAGQEGRASIRPRADSRCPVAGTLRVAVARPNAGMLL